MPLEEGCPTLNAQLSIFEPKLEHSSPYGQILLKYLKIKINDKDSSKGGTSHFMSKYRIW